MGHTRRHSRRRRRWGSATPLPSPTASASPEPEPTDADDPSASPSPGPTPTASPEPEPTDTDLPTGVGNDDAPTGTADPAVEDEASPPDETPAAKGEDDGAEITLLGGATYYPENHAATGGFFCYERAGNVCGGWHFPAYAYSEAGAHDGNADASGTTAGNVIRWFLPGPDTVTIHTFDYAAVATSYRLLWGPDNASWPAHVESGIPTGDKTINVTESGTIKFVMDTFSPPGTKLGFDGITVGIESQLLVETAPDGTILLENGATAGDPVDTFSGAFTYSHTDVAIAGRGPAPVLTRSYSSADTRVGPLGPGWTHSYNARLRVPEEGSDEVLYVRANGNTDVFTANPDGSYAPQAATYATLVSNTNGTYTITDKDRSALTFDTTGRLVELADRHGNASALTYNGSGELVSIADPAGRGSLTLGYTGGRLTSVTDWLTPARTVSYAYDTEGRLQTVTDREGEVTTYGYDGTSSRLATITDAREHVALTLTYDAQGRVATQKDARGPTSGATTTFDYVVNGDGTRVTTTTLPATSFEPAFTPTIEDHFSAQGWITERTVRPSTSETLTETYRYDSAGSRSSVTDVGGNRTDYCFDIDYTGDTISGSRGNLTRTIGPSPAAGQPRPVTLLAYDARDNLTQRVVPRGVPSGATVTCATDVSAITTAYATDFAYDASGARLLSTTTRATDPEAGLRTMTTTYEYGDAANPGLVTRSIPPRGNTTGSPDYSFATTFSYFTSGNRAGMLAELVDPLGNTTSLDYDPVGRLIASVDPIGNAAGEVPADHRTTFSYDREDRLRITEQPAPTPAGDPLLTEVRYDEVGNAVVRIDPNEQVTTYAFDERDRLAQVLESPSFWTDPAAPPSDVIATGYEYDDAGHLTRVIRAVGDAANERVTDYEYDGRGLARIERQYPAWPSTTGALVTGTTFDELGNPATATDPLGRTTTYEYDARGLLTAIDFSEASTPDVAYEYDLEGNRTRMIDGTGTTTYITDEAGRMTSVTSPGSTTVGYRFDLDGNRTELIHPDGFAVTYAFDKASRLASLADTGGRSVAYGLRADNQVDEVTHPNGTSTTYGYDNAQRLIDILHAGPTAATIDQLTYDLDDVGNVTGIASPQPGPSFGRPDGLASSNGAWSGTFAAINETAPDDATFLASPSGPSASNYYEVTLGDAAQIGNSSVSVRYRYAKSGNNSGQTINLTVQLRQGSTVIASATHSNIPGVSGSGWQTGSFSLTPAQRAAITDPADLRLRFAPVASGSGQKRSGQISWAEVEFGAPSGLGGTTTYGYDKLYRLASATDAAGSRSYEYDPAGNRTSKTSGSSTAYTFDRADRILSAGAASTTVDANGNLTARGSDTFEYDQANRLVTATVAGTTETYTYDGDGVRFSRQVGSGPVIRYVTDVNGSLPVTIADGTRKYIWGVGLAYSLLGASVEVHHADRLGSVRELTGPTGAVLAAYRSDEYGVPSLALGTSAQPFRFTGEPLDASGLTYLRARYYEPTLGRFMSRDSWPGSPSVPQSLDRFTFALNRPSCLTDPSGQFPGDPLFLIGAFPSNYCADLYGDHQRAVEEIGQRIFELETDALGLRANHMYVPHPRYGSVQGHVEQITMKQRNLSRIEANYNRNCSGGPPLPPVFPGVTAPVSMPAARPVSTVDPTAVVGGGLLVGGGLYVAYRVGRFIPSLFPPLWWTMGPNAVLP